MTDTSTTEAMAPCWEHLRLTGGSIECVIAIRPEYRGRKVKESALRLNGMKLRFEPMWQMDDDENYPDEWALREAGDNGMKDICESAMWRIAGLPWIASGDVILSAAADMAPQEQT